VPPLFNFYDFSVLYHVSTSLPCPLRSASTDDCTGSSKIIQLELSSLLRLLIVLNSVGEVALCSISKKGLKQTGSIKAERWLNSEDAMCASVSSDQQMLAVGCSRGVVELYELADSVSHLRTVSLYDWGVSPWKHLLDHQCTVSFYFH